MTPMHDRNLWRPLAGCLLCFAGGAIWGMCLLRQPLLGWLCVPVFLIGLYVVERSNDSE